MPFMQLSSSEKAESSAEILKRVEKAREIQRERYKGEGIFCNSHRITSYNVCYTKLLRILHFAQVDIGHKIVYYT